VHKIGVKMIKRLAHINAVFMSFFKKFKTFFMLIFVILAVFYIIQRTSLQPNPRESFERIANIIFFFYICSLLNKIIKKLSKIIKILSKTNNNFKK
jgi:predicted small integral membrane protein